MTKIPKLTTEWTSSVVRSTFTSYFESKQHVFVPSSSTIPHSDPTLLFTNSGMAQFKSIFLGTCDPHSDLFQLKRACNSQKCIRAGGKHNDLEDVGRDTYHHTMFEMLGNWSFGDYFKKDAINYAWDLLVNVYGLHKERLYVTYFEGDEKLGLPADLEAKDLWLKVGVEESHILPGNSKDNFWEMGPVGPCGPCSELHYDRIGGRNASNLVNKDDPNVIEIWNLVFMQYNRQEDTSLKLLPNKHIDTGMGFERLVSILQDKPSNYDTDVFSGLFEAIRVKTGKREYRGLLGDDDKDGIDTAYRVVADHLRTLTFAISDGGLPSNEGRGYVLRRILRRGARYARKKFDVPIGNFFSGLVDTLVLELGSVFPELSTKIDHVKEVLDDEEKSFAKTLDRGEKLFNECIKKMDKSGQKIITGADAWRLYDTFGFPMDLTRLMAAELGYKIDEVEFEKEQLKSKEISKQTKNNDNIKVITMDVHVLGEIEKELKLKVTDDSFKYYPEDIKAEVKAIFSNGKFVNENGVLYEQFGLLLDKTNFYAEQGGQIYDTGSITLDDKFDFLVENVQVFAGHVLHIGHLKFGTVAVGDQPTLSFDEIRRALVRNNHTATHILNFALRKTVGEIVDQKGSLVVPNKLRFDYSCKSACTVDQISSVEAIVSEIIKKNANIYYKDVPLSQAKLINGLRAVFGEVYPDPVRVVSVGVDVEEMLKDPSNEKWKGVSVEFCGGT